MDVKTIGGRTLAIALSVALTYLAVPRVQAAPHLVAPGDMTTRLIEQASSRQERVELFQRALAEPEVRQQARAMGVDAERLSRVIPHLTDKELADLAQRAERTQDVAAGHHRHDGETALVIIGVALLVVGLIILAALVDDSYYWDDCDCYW
jgi:Flp pilus assembly protein TadB